MGDNILYSILQCQILVSCLGKSCCCRKKAKKVGKDEDVNVSVNNKISINTAPHYEIHEVKETSKGFPPIPLCYHKEEIKVVDEASEPEVWNS